MARKRKPQPTDRKVHQLAKLIARRLFTNGRKQVADRLVLFQEEYSGAKTKELGGWCREAAEAQIERALLDKGVSV